jgi:hypothetical protein
MGRAQRRGVARRGGSDRARAPGRCVACEGARRVTLARGAHSTAMQSAPLVVVVVVALAGVVLEIDPALHVLATTSTNALQRTVGAS